MSTDTPENPPTHFFVSTQKKMLFVYSIEPSYSPTRNGFYPSAPPYPCTYLTNLSRVCSHKDINNESKVDKSQKDNIKFNCSFFSSMYYIITYSTLCEQSLALKSTIQKRPPLGDLFEENISLAQLSSTVRAEFHRNRDVLGHIIRRIDSHITAKRPGRPTHTISTSLIFLVGFVRIHIRRHSRILINLSKLIQTN